MPAGAHGHMLAAVPLSLGAKGMTESELREHLAPRVAAKLQARLRGAGLPSIEAEQLAHEVIAMVQAAQAESQLSGPGAGEGLAA